MAAPPAAVAPAPGAASGDGTTTQLLNRDEVVQLIRVRTSLASRIKCASLNEPQALEAMKQAGVPASDKKYATMVKLLRSQNLSSLGFVKAPSSATTQQAAPQPAPAPSTASTSAPAEGAQPGDPALVQMNEDLQQQKQVPSTVKTSPFSPAQVQQLKAQILAYRYLTHNMALPPNLLLAIRGVAPSVRVCLCLLSALFTLSVI